MINRAGLESLPPAKRAELIYGEAQAEMSRRLWQVALGDSDSDKTAGLPRSASLAPRVQDGNSLDALLAALTQKAAGRRDAVEPSQVPAIARPVVAPVAALTRTPAPTAPVVAASGTGPIKGLGPNSCYSAALAAAADRVGVPAPALAAIVEAEAGKAPDGSWKVYSRNPRSSAAGLGQFLNRTWEGLAETRGTWLNDHAAKQGWLGANGQVRADSRAAVLATRYDPTAAINGIADYARRNLDGLRRAGVSTDNDVSATARLAYLGHHLGLGDAVRFLRGNGLSEGRARVLLNAQVGVSNSARRIAATGDASVAHREWLVGYLDRNIHTDRFSRQYGLIGHWDDAEQACAIGTHRAILAYDPSKAQFTTFVNWQLRGELQDLRFRLMTDQRPSAKKVSATTVSLHAVTRGADGDDAYLEAMIEDEDAQDRTESAAAEHMATTTRTRLIDEYLNHLHAVGMEQLKRRSRTRALPQRASETLTPRLRSEMYPIDQADLDALADKIALHREAIEQRLADTVDAGAPVSSEDAARERMRQVAKRAAAAIADIADRSPRFADGLRLPATPRFRQTRAIAAAVVGE